MDKKSFESSALSEASSTAQSCQAMAEGGDAEMQFNLGLKHASARLPAQDYAKAEQWYLRAAAQNHPLAQFNLAMMYAHGQGGPCDWEKASVWLQKAADLGDAGAQYQMGVNDHRAAVSGGNVDVLQSKINAWKWFRLAALQGYQAAEIAGDVVTMGMTREDVLEAGRRVEAFNAEGE